MQQEINNQAMERKRMGEVLREKERKGLEDNGHEWNKKRDRKRKREKIRECKRIIENVRDTFFKCWKCTKVTKQNEQILMEDIK